MFLPSTRSFETQPYNHDRCDLCGYFFFCHQLGDKSGDISLHKGFARCSFVLNDYLPIVYVVVISMIQ